MFPTRLAAGLLSATLACNALAADFTFKFQSSDPSGVKNVKSVPPSFQRKSPSFRSWITPFEWVGEYASIRTAPFKAMRIPMKQTGSSMCFRSDGSLR